MSPHPACSPHIPFFICLLAPFYSPCPSALVLVPISPACMMWRQGMFRTMFWLHLSSRAYRRHPLLLPLFLHRFPVHRLQVVDTVGPGESDSSKWNTQWYTKNQGRTVSLGCSRLLTITTLPGPAPAGPAPSLVSSVRNTFDADSDAELDADLEWAGQGALEGVPASITFNFWYVLSSVDDHILTRFATANSARATAVQWAARPRTLCCSCGVVWCVVC